MTEGVAAGSAAAASGLPWWASWTLEDSESGRLRSGESLQASGMPAALGEEPAGECWSRAEPIRCRVVQALACDAQQGLV